MRRRSYAARSAVWHSRLAGRTTLIRWTVGFHSSGQGHDMGVVYLQLVTSHCCCVCALEIVSAGEMVQIFRRKSLGICFFVTLRFLNREMNYLRSIILWLWLFLLIIATQLLKCCSYLELKSTGRNSL
jgi:hypothetical protein